MANTVIALKKSATPSSVPADLANGELAINYADGKLYYKAANGTIASISGNEPNYFGSVNANNTLVVADTPGDVFTLATGNNIVITGDAINDKITVGLTNDVNLPGTLTLGAVGGDEGGELKLANALTNSVLSGKVIIDIYQNKLRFYEEAGTNRGAFIDLSAASGGVATDLLAGSSGTDTIARQWATGAFGQANIAYAQANAAYDAANNAVTDFSPAFIQANTTRVHANAAFASANAGQATANAAFAKANAALPNTSGVTFDGDLSISQNLTAVKVISTSNGEAENFKVGDDAWIGDFNVANTIKIKGVQNNQISYISFGTGDAKALGRDGTGHLTYDNNIVWHQGNDGSGSGLDADLLDGQNGTYYGRADDVTAAFALGNNAFARANTANITADRAWNHANAAFITANIAFANANTVMISAQAAFTVANASFLHANASYIFANSAHAIANLAFAHANAAFLVANTSGTETEAAFLRANLAHAHANAAFATVNSAFGVANAALPKTGGSITGNLAITGSLTVQGNVYLQDTVTIEVSDPLLYLAGNNYTSDIVDIGFVANYVNATGQNVHTGFFRDATIKEYYLFEGYDKEPEPNHIDTAGNNFTISVLNATVKTSNLILGGTNTIPWITASFNHANAAHASANAGMAIANAAFNRANTANITADRAWNHANAAFNKSNNALANTSSVSFNGTLNFPTGNLTVGTTVDLGYRFAVKGGTLGTGAGNTINAWVSYSDTSNDDKLVHIIERNSDGSDWRSANHKLTRIVDATTMGWMKFGSMTNDLITFGEGATEYVRIDGSGKVGIGTVDPSTTLHVMGRITSESESPLIYLRDNVAVNATQYVGYIDFRDSTDTRAGYIGFGSTNTPDFYMYASDPSGNIRFHSGGTTERMRIAASGNVLIGRTTDSTIGSSVKLDVNGAINAAALLVNDGSAVLNNETTLITVGYNVATYNASANIAAFGTWQPNPSNGNYQVARCNGAVTITTPPANSAIDILFINSVRRNPGAVTFSGYSVGTYTGTTYDTTSNNRFILSIRELAGVATYSWYALQ